MKIHRREIEALILDGENDTTEFKRKFTSPEKIAREIIAFANSHGGYLLIGVDDDRSIVGIESEKELRELLLFVQNFYTAPPVQFESAVIEIEGKDILVVYIPESNQKPHRLVEHPRQKKHLQKVFIRQNDQSVIATKEMIQFLEAQAYREEQLLFVMGENEKLLFRYLDRYQKITAKEYSRLVNISERRAARELWQLVKIGVLAFHHSNGNEYYTIFDDPRTQKRLSSSQGKQR